MKNTKGITLIALVITIIVLLILAGVSISAISGENGIVAKAREAAEKTKEAEQKETSDLDSLDKEIDEILNDAEDEEEELELNEYGFYYNTFYVGTVYTDLFKMNLEGAFYFMDDNVCLWYNTTDGATNIFKWYITDRTLTIKNTKMVMVIKENGNLFESGTNCSMRLDKDYKIPATKNEQGFYYNTAYFMKNIEIYPSQVKKFLLLKENGTVHDDSVNTDGTGSSGSASYDLEDYTFSNNGKTVTREYNLQTEVYEIPEDIYDLQ